MNKKEKEIINERLDDLKRWLIVICIVGLVLFSIVFVIFIPDNNSSDEQRLTSTEYCNLQGFRTSKVIGSNSDLFMCYSYKSREYTYGNKIYDVNADYMLINNTQR